MECTSSGAKKSLDFFDPVSKPLSLIHLMRNDLAVGSSSNAKVAFSDGLIIEPETFHYFRFLFVCDIFGFCNSNYGNVLGTFTGFISRYWVYHYFNRFFIYSLIIMNYFCWYTWVNLTDVVSMGYLKKYLVTH